MNLKQYEQEKFAIAEIIRSAQAIDSKDQTLHFDCRALLTCLAEDRFNLLVVGQFSRGKSTLMNALLGADLLPTGIVPLTSVITTVRYGSRKQVVLTFVNSGSRREVPLAKLAEYVTQQANPGNVKNVACAEIELPVELLRRGFFSWTVRGWDLRSPAIRRPRSDFFRRPTPSFWLPVMKARFRKKKTASCAGYASPTRSFSSW
jgi:hypothetical protein